MYIFLDDRLVDASEAKVSVYDHGFLYGDGVYETMRAYEGVVFRLDEHIARLVRSAELIHMKLPDKKELACAVYEAVVANRLDNAYIRVTVSRGKGPIGLDPALCRKLTIVVIAETFHPYPEALYRDGVELIISPVTRNFVGAIDPRIKSLNFLNNILAKITAREQGAYEAIMCNFAGYLAEGTVSNIFFVRAGEVHTPSVEAGILDGITREAVIGLARESGYAVHEGLYTPADIFAATEVFFTNTTAEVMPVCRVDDTRYEVGGVAGILRECYRGEVEKYIRKSRER